MEANRISADVLLTIRPIRIADILDVSETKDLLREYTVECSIPQIGETNPQRAIYDQMEASGLMHCFGVYEGSVLVGFAILLVFVLPHYGKKVANVESLFMRKSHRRGGSGRLLLSAIEKFSREKQCAAMLYNVRKGSNLERLFTVLPQYEQTNSVFVKTL